MRTTFALGCVLAVAFGRHHKLGSFVDNVKDSI